MEEVQRGPGREAQQIEQLQALVGLFPDDEALLCSPDAARLNGFLAGFGEPAAMAAVLAELPLSAEVARRLVVVVQELRRHGGL